MNPFKRTILFLLSLLPVQAIAFAADFSRQVETLQVSEIDLEQEFLRRLDSDLLHNKYYNFFEENGVFSVDELLLPANSKFKHRALKQFKKEFNDNILTAGNANSMIPE